VIAWPSWEVGLVLFTIGFAVGWMFTFAAWSLWSWRK